MRASLVSLVAAMAAISCFNVGAASAASPQQTIIAGIAKAVAAGRLTGSEAGYDRAVTNRAATLIASLPRSRSAPLAANLGQVAAQASNYTTPIAVTLFHQLGFNSTYLATKPAPTVRTDAVDTDGIVYRWFSGSGFEFHPLANFGALNANVAIGNVTAAKQIETALIARAVPDVGGGVAWEYFFSFEGGRAPWTSGMAQAVAAQAFAAAANLLPDETQLLPTAKAAFRTIPGRLVQTTTAGPWIRLYSFNSAVVLNAQLQSIISLQGYAAAAGDVTATTLASSMADAAAKKLPSFDTGYWSYYQLPSIVSPVDYQDYVVTLLKRLSVKDKRFTSAAAQFASYDKVPPAFKLAAAGSAEVKFWVSKPATVTVSGGAAPKVLSVTGGWHTVTFPVPPTVGTYPLSLSARDWLGNTAKADALPMVRVATTSGQSVGNGRPTATTAGVRAVAGTAGQSIRVMIGLDVMAQMPLALKEGIDAVRWSMIWQPGATGPDPNLVAQLLTLPAPYLLTLEIYATPVPTDDAGRAALASFAQSLVQQVPAIHEILLGPPPTRQTASAYVAALMAVNAGAKATNPGVIVGGELDGSVQPRQVLLAIGNAYVATGGTLPLMDELAFRPALTNSSAVWGVTSYPTLVKTLTQAFSATSIAGATLPILYDQVAVQAAVPSDKAPLYSDPAAPTIAGSEAAQATAYTTVLTKATCQPTVAGVLFHRLADTGQPGEESGIFYPDGAAKTSAPAFATAVAAARSGVSTACVPTAPPATAASASNVTFPTTLAASVGAPTVKFTCAKDCLYLVTLDRVTDGKPVLAARGAVGAATATTVTLPKLPVAPGSYHLTVRLVNQTDPGPLETLQSDALTAA